jgi:hypothetical protein
MLVQQDCASKESVEAKHDKKGDLATFLQMYKSPLNFVKTCCSYVQLGNGNLCSSWHLKFFEKKITSKSSAI